MADLTSSVSSSVRRLSSGSRYITLEFSQSRLIPTNQSDISWTLKGAGTAPGYVMTGPIEASIDGKTVYSSSNRIELRNGTIIATGKLTVDHNDDGSKQLPISISAAIYEYAVNVSGSQTFTLISNPRESTVTASDTEIGKICNIQISKSVSSYTSTISYNLYKDSSRSSVLASGRIDDEKTSKTTIPWQVPVEFYRLLWDTPSGYCEILCDTYNGNSKVGRTSSTAILVTMDNSVNPKIVECVAINGNPTISGITGSDGFILGQGLITVRCSATAQASATISSITVTNNGNTYSLTNGVTSQIANPTDSNFVFKITDSRGKSAEQVVSLTVYNYDNPSISITQMAMGLNPDDSTKGLITVSVSGNGYKGNIATTQNTPTIEFKVTDENDNSVIVPNTQELVWSLNLDGAYHLYEVKNVALSVDDPNSTYKIVAIIKDEVNTEGVESSEVSVSRIPVFDYGKSSFNFNVPLYYHDKPFIDTLYEAGMLMLETPIIVRYEWSYQVIKDTFVEIVGKALISGMSYDTAVGNIWSKAGGIQIPLPIRIDTWEAPHTITTELSPDPDSELENTPLGVPVLMTASARIEDDGYNQQASVQCLAPIQYQNIDCILHIRISGSKEWSRDDYAEEIPEDSITE